MFRSHRRRRDAGPTDTTPTRRLTASRGGDRARGRRRGRHGLLAAATATVVAAGGVAALTAGSAQAAPGDGLWSTSGSQIVDAEGNPVRMTGINWFGMETDTFAPHGLWERSYQDMLDQVKELGYNTLRLPYSNQLFDAGSTPNGIDFTLNPDLQGRSGLEIMDTVIGYAGDIGLKVVLDRHRPDAAGQSGLWYTDRYSEQRWIDDWVMLAERYAGDDTVVGADLHNEPHDGPTWGSGDQATDWRLAAERAGNAILAANPDWLIIVEGTDCFQDDCTWWGGNLKGAHDFPVRLDDPTKLVYSAHEYATSVFDQPWFDDPDFPDNMPARWDDYWGFLENENIAPVLLGEFGSTLTAEKDRQWLALLLEYMGTGASGMDFTYWSLNPNSGDTGGILNNDWTTVDTTKQSFLDPYLLPVGDAGDSGDPGGETPGSVSCEVDYEVTSRWDGGFQAEVTLVNTSPFPIGRWSLGWDSPERQEITNGWNAELTQTGQHVTATGAGHNDTLSANGGSTTFGFVANAPANGDGDVTAKPATFAVNGATCS